MIPKKEFSVRNPIVMVAIVTMALIAFLYWFFGTELGASIRATGANANMARAQGINTDANKMIGLMLANGLVALSGALFGQYNGNALYKSVHGVFLPIILIQILITLQKSHRVRLHLADILQLHIGQDHQILLDGQIYLARHLKVFVLQDAVIGDDRARNGVLYRHQTHISLASLHRRCHLTECVAGHNLYAVTAEVVVGGNMVEAGLVALYRNFQHI